MKFSPLQMLQRQTTKVEKISSNEQERTLNEQKAAPKHERALK